MAGFARSGMGGGAAGVNRVNKDRALKAEVARGMRTQSSPEQHAEAATEPTATIPVVPPPTRVPVLSPPVHVDLACTRPHAERQDAVRADATDVGTMRNVDAKPMANLPKASPTLPQTNG